MKLMFIDDESDSIAPAMDEIIGSIADATTLVFNFEHAIEQLSSFKPDIIILDVWDGPPQTSIPEGKNVMDIIWDEHFCPVIVYSADSTIIQDVQEYNHPLIEFVTKGSDSELQIREVVEEMRGQVEIMRGAETLTRQAISNAMRELTPYAFRACGDDHTRLQSIDRGVRRRVAAMMDEAPEPDQPIAGWEQYICPPVSRDLRLGDVLRCEDAEWDNPDSLRVILTPSCDIVTGRNKVDHILVAKCCTLGEVLSRSNIRQREPSIKASHMLTQGFINHYLPFPALPDVIPPMAANLKDLELIPFEDVGDEETRFKRVASVDSPFRELVSWAYLQTTGRIGLPERNTELWIQEILGDIANRAGENNS